MMNRSHNREPQTKFVVVRQDARPWQSIIRGGEEELESMSSDIERQEKFARSAFGGPVVMRDEDEKEKGEDLSSEREDFPEENDSPVTNQNRGSKIIATSNQMKSPLKRSLKPTQTKFERK
eukprot:TRINITY_DN326_c0_g1_i13.p4 TRINITY_DN326_c0_g1~~TRINITY_DN326_c0_g1_i13.p4  ORF type:complete len:121 (-),score=38.41 TRINITY_DN326_c0_g1_i13:2538-2900(-)